MQKDDVQNIKTFSVLICAAHFYILVFKKIIGFVFSTNASILRLLYSTFHVCLIQSALFYVTEKSACEVELPPLLY